MPFDVCFHVGYFHKCNQGPTIENVNGINILLDTRPFRELLQINKLLFPSERFSPSQEKVSEVLGCFVCKLFAFFEKGTAKVIT